MSSRGTLMHRDTRKVLDYVVANPGVTRAAIVAALPHINVPQKLSNLNQQAYVYVERVKGTKIFYWYPVQKKPFEKSANRFGGRAAPVGELVPPRQTDYRVAWTEPYLSDAGVRRDGLQYRDCPSRRGNTLVYCYRRQA